MCLHLYVYMCAFDPPSPGLSHDESTKRRGLHPKTVNSPALPGLWCNFVKRHDEFEKQRRHVEEKGTVGQKENKTNREKIAREENISNKTAEMEKKST